MDLYNFTINSSKSTANDFSSYFENTSFVYVPDHALTFFNCSNSNLKVN